MGDVFYNKNGVLTRLEMRLGDGTATGKKIMPLWKNPNGDTIKIPQLSNMLLNLSKYAFFINNRLSCSQYIDGSDLELGKLTFTNSAKSIGTDPFNDQLAQDSVIFTGVPNNQYALNTQKGVWFIKRSSEPGLGIKLPQELIQSQGDAFTLSVTFAFNNAIDWGDILQIIRNGSTRANDGYLRIEKSSGNGLYIYHSKADGTTPQIQLSSGSAHDKIMNVIMRITRQAQTNDLLADVWFNGQKIATQTNLGAMRGNPFDLLCLGTVQTGTNCPMNLYFFSLRVWNVGLSDSDIDMLTKIEARNLGLELLNPSGLNLWTYLSS